MPDDCKKIVAELPFYFDEPFSDNSAVPTILVSRLARKDVKVALSADAGDETFAGYNSYASLEKTLKVLELAKGVHGKGYAKAALVCSRLTNPYSFLREKSECFSKLLNVDPHERVATAFEYGGSLMESMYSRLLNIGYPQPQFVMNDREYSDPISVGTAIDYINYMPNDILVKVDRAAMSTSLEGREPLIDHRIIEFAARLPIEYKFSKGIKKRIYKDIVYKYIPKEMMDRPKTGFTMPIEDWLKTDLKYLVEENINPSALDAELFNVENVCKIKNLFYQNKLGHEEKVIWRMLEFQLWYKYNIV